jgi:hypothetical protein
MGIARVDARAPGATLQEMATVRWSRRVPARCGATCVQRQNPSPHLHNAQKMPWSKQTSKEGNGVKVRRARAY